MQEKFGVVIIHIRSIIPFMLVLFIFIACTSTASLAQPAVEWAKTMGDRGYDIGYSVVPTGDGGFVVAGVTSARNQDSMCIFKVDPDGDMQWEKIYDGRAYDIQQTSDGGYIVAGDTGPNSQKLLAVLVKVNASGDLEWRHTYSHGIGMGVVQADDGGYLITGTDLFLNGPGQAYAFKTLPDGTESWNKTYGSYDLYSSQEISKSGDGSYYIAGTAVRNDSYGIGILQIDAGGNVTRSVYCAGIIPGSLPVLWNRSFVRQTGDGGYVVTGSTSGTSDTINLCLVKIDATGKTSWRRTFPDSLGSCGRSVLESGDGGFVVAGFANISYHSVPGFYNDAPMVYGIKVDSHGYTIWENQLFSGYGLSMCPAKDGGFVITGETWNATGDPQILLIKIKEMSSQHSSMEYCPKTSILNGPMSDMSLIFENNVFTRIIIGNESISNASIAPVTGQGNISNTTTKPYPAPVGAHMPPQIPTIRP